MTFIKKKSTQIIFFVFIGCLIMTLVESLIQPTYLYKSVIKIATFVLCIAVYCLLNKDFDIINIFKIKSKKDFLISILLGVIVFAVILGGYSITKNIFDFSNITSNLLGKENISKDNFIYVSIYISIVNSLLEELFFRGFAFIKLRKHISSKFAYIFSAFMFSLYHIFIMSSWFTFGLFILLITALIGVGVFFNFLDRHNVIYNSWIVHMAANLSINTIGMILLGII